jgi:hypothetical protein
MKNLTPESMIESIEWYAINGDRHQMFDVFFKMHFHGFIDEKTWDAFCEAWKEKRLYE